MMNTILLSIRIWLASASILVLALATPCQTPSADNRLSDLLWFSGHWSCEGKFTTSGKSISADLSFEPALENKWLIFRHDDRPPFTYHALSEWGWDEKRHQLMSAIQDSTGGMRVFYSPGFSDSRLVWEGRGLGNSAAPSEKFEFEKLGPNIFTVSYSFQKEGNWKAVDKSTCTRKSD